MEIIVTHKNTDFDAFSSLIAAKILYPNALPILPNSLRQNVKNFLSLHKDYLKFFSIDDIIADKNKIKKIIIVDTNNWNRIEKGEIFQNSNVETIIWDHHKKSNLKAHTEHIEKIGSTTTMLVEKIRKENKKISTIEATIFLMGIYEDTGFLSFLSTTPRDVFIAGFLLEQEAELSILNRFLTKVYNEEQKDILMHMIENGEREYIENKKINISIVAIKLKKFINNISPVVTMYMDIMNVDAAFGIFITDTEKCIVIGRSRNDIIDVGKILSGLGGGGHIGAASALIKQKVNPEAIEDHLKELIAGNQESTIYIGDIMSFPVDTISPDMTMREMRKLAGKKGYIGFPVVENDKLIGMISIRDYKKLTKESQKNSPVKAFMRTNIITMDKFQSPSEAARIMIKNNIGRIPIVEDDKIIGIVARYDVMRYFYDFVPSV